MSDELDANLEDDTEDVSVAAEAAEPEELLLDDSDELMPHDDNEPEELLFEDDEPPVNAKIIDVSGGDEELELEDD
jgi:hypothetical protein